MSQTLPTETDVFVIGGGPAGLAAAITARQRGFRVVVADGAQPPVDKACGEGFLPDGLEALEPAFAGGQRQQRVQQALLVAPGSKQFLARGAQARRIGVRVSECDLQQGALDRKRRAQLVGGVGHKAPLGGERRFQSAKDIVERVA